MGQVVTDETGQVFSWIPMKFDHDKQQLTCSWIKSLYYDEPATLQSRALKG